MHAMWRFYGDILGPYSEAASHARDRQRLAKTSPQGSRDSLQVAFGEDMAPFQAASPTDQSPGGGGSQAVESDRLLRSITRHLADLQKLTPPDISGKTAAPAAKTPAAAVMVASGPRAYTGRPPIEDAIAVEFSNLQWDVVIAEGPLQRLMDRRTAALARRSVLACLAQIGQGVDDPSYYRDISTTHLPGWDVLLFEAQCEERSKWGLIWELADGTSERDLVANAMFVSGYTSVGSTGSKAGGSGGGGGAGGGKSSRLTEWTEAIPVSEHELVRTLVARVWFVGPLSEVRGPAGRLAIAKLRLSHMKGVQGCDRVAYTMQELRPRRRDGPVSRAQQQRSSVRV